MSSFIPEVSAGDVERILDRDFPSEHHAEIQQWIDAVDEREKCRVVAACLKNCGGDLGRLKSDLAEVGGYWRELIAEAEYPKIKKARNLSKEQISEKQKRQYLDWFERS